MKYKHQQKVLSVIAVIIFTGTLIPVLYLSKYVHATGDDYGYGTITHAVWLNSHSVSAVIRAALTTVKNYYNGWQGTWFSVFLFSLQPEVFSPDAYWLVPFVMLGLNILSTSVVIHYFLVRKAGLDTYTCILVDCAVLFMQIQFFPSTRSGIFWYNGTAHYIVPYSIAMLTFYFLFRYLENSFKRYLVLVSIGMLLLGGGNYLAVLFTCIVLVLAGVSCFRKAKVQFLMIPLALALAGLAVSYASPGNKVRGGADFGFTLSRTVYTIQESFRQSFATILIYLEDKPVVFILFMAVTVIVWRAYVHSTPRCPVSRAAAPAKEDGPNGPLKLWKRSFPDNTGRFRYPLLFAACSYCVYSAVFAPGIFAGTEVSGGVPNTIFQIFILMVTADIIYILGWIKTRMAEEPDKKWAATADSCSRLPFLVLAAAVCLTMIIMNKSSLHNTTFMSCVDYISSGQAADYGEQMDERLAILLDTSVCNVKLPAINQDQGPLMHMEITDDPDAWTNQVSESFYGKESVIEVPRH